MTKEDNELKIAMENCVKAVLLILDQNAPERYSLRDLLFYYIPRIARTNYELEKLIPTYQLPEAQKFKDLIGHHSVIGQHIHSFFYAGFQGLGISEWDILRKFIHTLIIKQRNLKFNSEEYKVVFELMMNFFKSKEVSVQFFTMITNFHFLNEDSFELFNGWNLVRIGKTLENDWIGFSSLDSLVSPSKMWVGHALKKEILIPKYIVNPELKGRSASDIRKKISDIYDGIIEEIDTIISSFRLLKEGSISRDKVDTQLTGWYPFIDSSDSQPPDTKVQGTKYLFSVEDVPRLNQIIALLATTRLDSRFQVALRRLDYAVERGRNKPDDVILDGMIAFESLIGEEKALKYRIALRTAMLLGETPDDRKEFKKDLATAYDLRSKIVHGGTKKEKDRILKKWGIDINQAAERITNLLRQFLLKYIDALSIYKTREKVISKLDDRILNDASTFLLDEENLPKTNIIDYLISLGGTPNKVVELLLKRGLCKKKD